MKNCMSKCLTHRYIQCRTKENSGRSVEQEERPQKLAVTCGQTYVAKSGWQWATIICYLNSNKRYHRDLKDCREMGADSTGQGQSRAILTLGSDNSQREGRILVGHHGGGPHFCPSHRVWMDHWGELVFWRSCSPLTSELTIYKCTLNVVAKTRTNTNQYVKIWIEVFISLGKLILELFTKDQRLKEFFNITCVCP